MNLSFKDTPCGRICGIENEDYLEFRGIRYATAGRWEYPEEVTGWGEEHYDATEYGANCFQRRAFEEDSECNPFYHKEFREGLEFHYSEDCLFLNIWAPKDAEKVPVIVYIHGGSFTGGSNDEGHVIGAEYAKRGVILASMNYRLGPYGFCSHPDLKDRLGRIGNYGLYDQFMAVKWLRHNVQAFGGDPDRIILMGESAGAMSVDIQLNNPWSLGYYKGAILMSGAAIQRQAGRPLKPERTRDFWDTIIKKAGCNNIEELRRVDEKTLFYAWFDAQKEFKLSPLYTIPTKDGIIIKDKNFTMDTIPRLPIMVGVTTADMAAAVLLELTKRFSKKAIKNGSDCYVYCFARDLPGDNLGAWHASDLFYAFNTFDVSWRPWEDIDRKISDEFMSSIIAFARTGNPNNDKIPEWKIGFDNPMMFNENTGTGKWDRKLYIHNTLHNDGPI